MIPPIFRVDLLFSGKSFWICHYIHIQKCAPMVALNTFGLTMEIHHHVLLGCSTPVLATYQQEPSSYGLLGNCLANWEAGKCLKSCSTVLLEQQKHTDIGSGKLKDYSKQPFLFSNVNLWKLVERIHRCISFNTTWQPVSRKYRSLCNKQT